MSNKVFQQNLDDKKGPQPGGPYLIQMLFKEPVEMPDKEKMTAIMEKHIGSTECFCYDKKMAGFAAQEHIAEFKDGKCPVQLMVMKCDKFKGKGFDAFLMSQMWDCQEDRDRIFRECKYQVVATDMLTAALPALERANLDADFLEALLCRKSQQTVGIPLQCSKVIELRRAFGFFLAFHLLHRGTPLLSAFGKQQFGILFLCKPFAGCRASAGQFQIHRVELFRHKSGYRSLPHHRHGKHRSHDPTDR